MAQLLADLVRAELPRDAPYWAEGKVLRQWPELVAEWLPDDNTPIVIADDVAAWIDMQEDQKPGRSLVSLTEELLDGPLRMAPAMYPRFWVESRWAVQSGGSFRLGQMVDAFPDGDDGAMLVSVVGFVENEHGIHAPRLGLHYRQEADGTVNVRLPRREDGSDASGWLMHPTLWTDEDLPRHMTVGDNEPKWVVESTAAIKHAELVIAACAFAICRNVPTTSETVPPKVARKRTAQLGRPATTSYSRIRLPGFSGWRTAAKLASGAGSQLPPALHPVRAHPKTFRRNPDGTGGLGRYHLEGTWLWQPHLRGRSEHGSRIPRVIVSPPTEGPDAAG